jgi:hypothetical protein
MSIEIQDIRLIFPALVHFKKDNEEQSVFVYLDQSKMDIIIPDTTGIEDVTEFKEAFAKYYSTKNQGVKAPNLPKDMLKEIDPKTFSKGI